MTKEITSPGKSQGLQEAKRDDWPHRVTPEEKVPINVVSIFVSSQIAVKKKKKKG